jgi:hypothetical protein
MFGDTKSANPRAFGARSHTFIALLLAFAGFRSQAEAQASKQSDEATDFGEPLMPVHVSTQGSFTWDGEFALGGRVDYPLIERGLLLSTRDEVSVSGGLDVAFVSFNGGNPRSFWPTVTVVWSLGLSDRFAFAPELGLAGLIERDGWQGVFPNIGFGGKYYLWRSVAITGRIGWPMAISLGATF